MNFYFKDDLQDFLNIYETFTKNWVFFLTQFVDNTKVVLGNGKWTLKALHHRSSQYFTMINSSFKYIIKTYLLHFILNEQYVIKKN